MEGLRKQYDVVVVGGGAAGLTAAQYGARANLKILVLEQATMGGQCLLIEGLENYPGFPEPISGTDFAERFEAQARQFGAEFLVDSARSLRTEGGRFIITTGDDEIESKAVILATGAKHRELGVPGERELAGRGVSYCATCDGPFFKGKRMLVVGGGDAACDEAQFLSKLSDQVVLVHRRDRFRAQRSLAERVQANSAIDVRFNTVVREIVGGPSAFGIDIVNSVRLARTDTQEEYEEPFDAVFIFVGSIPQTDLVPDLEKDKAGYIKTDETMQTAVAGLFAAGDVRATSFRQLVVAAGEGAVAAHAAAHHIDALAGVEYEPAPA